MDQPKIDRLLRLMKLLTANHRYTIPQIAGRLGMSVRTVYRYVDTFREAGFVIKRTDDHVRIDRTSPYFRDLSELVHFTEEEAYILKSAIESIDENNLLKQNLKQKLYTVYDYKVLAECVTHGRQAECIDRLTDALHHQRQVRLCDYRSAHGTTIRDRLVEPFAFTTNYVQLWAYEPESGENRLFKVARIGAVELLAGEWLHEAEHRAGFMDLFRISSFEQLPVRLRLGLRAASLLTEEFPLAERELQRLSQTEWLLDMTVCSYEGVGRFVLGLLDDIQVEGPPEFAAYLRGRLTAAFGALSVAELGQSNILETDTYHTTEITDQSR